MFQSILFPRARRACILPTSKAGFCASARLEAGSAFPRALGANLLKQE